MTPRRGFGEAAQTQPTEQKFDRDQLLAQGDEGPGFDIEDFDAGLPPPAADSNKPVSRE